MAEAPGQTSSCGERPALQLLEQGRAPKVMPMVDTGPACRALTRFVKEQYRQRSNFFVSFVHFSVRGLLFVLTICLLATRSTTRAGIFVHIAY